jgi:hypothetical protein
MHGDIAKRALMERNVRFALGFLYESFVAVVRSITCASFFLAPFVYSVFSARFPSRGYVLILPFFPLQICAGVIVACLSFMLRGRKPYSTFVWVIPACFIFVNAVSTDWRETMSRLTYLMLPPFKMEQMDLTVPLFSSIAYSLSVVVLSVMESHNYIRSRERDEASPGGDS